MFCLIMTSKSGKPVVFKIWCALEIFDKRNWQMKLKVLRLKMLRMCTVEHSNLLDIYT